MDPIKNVNLPNKAAAQMLAAKAIRTIIKDAPEMRYECIECGCEIPPGKALRRCPKCREIDKARNQQ